MYFLIADAKIETIFESAKYSGKKVFWILPDSLVYGTLPSDYQLYKCTVFFIFFFS